MGILSWPLEVPQEGDSGLMTASDAAATEQTNPSWQHQGTTAVSFFSFLVLEVPGLWCTTSP